MRLATGSSPRSPTLPTVPCRRGRPRPIGATWPRRSAISPPRNAAFAKASAAPKRRRRRRVNRPDPTRWSEEPGSEPVSDAFVREARLGAAQLPRSIAMDKDDLSMVLTQAAPGETITVGAAHLRSMFAHGVHRAGEPIQRRIAQF